MFETEKGGGNLYNIGSQKFIDLYTMQISDTATLNQADPKLEKGSSRQ